MANDDMPDLFGGHEEYTRTRKTDPDTSRAAAKKIMPQMNDLQREVMSFVCQLEKGITHWERDAHFKSHHTSTYRTRLSELVDFGLVIKTGKTRRVASSNDPLAERMIWIWHEYADPFLTSPMPEKTPDPPRQTNAHFDDIGRFIHDRCAVEGCEAPASFGVGVSHLHGHLGMWYCSAHRPR
jgi:hypothetical protein